MFENIWNYSPKQVQATTASPLPCGGSASDDCDLQQPQQATMWLGTEDGHINVYNCTDNIRIKKNKEKFIHPAPVLGIL